MAGRDRVLARGVERGLGDDGLGDVMRGRRGQRRGRRRLSRVGMRGLAALRVAALAQYQSVESLFGRPRKLDGTSMSCVFPASRSEQKPAQWLAIFERDLAHQ